MSIGCHKDAGYSSWKPLAASANRVPSSAQARRQVTQQAARCSKQAAAVSCNLTASPHAAAAVAAAVAAVAAVEKPREGAMDAGFFCKLTQLGAQATAKLLTHQQARQLALTLK